MKGEFKGAAVATEIVALLNQQRANNGLPELTWNANLTQSAQVWADDMAERDDFPEKSSLAYRLAYEAIAQHLDRSFGSFYRAAKDCVTAEEVIRTTDLYNGTESNTEIGIGISCSADGAVYWFIISASPYNEAMRTAFEVELTRLVNIERVNAGLQRITKNESLSAVARIKAQDMADCGYCDHKSATYGYPDQMVRDILGISARVGENAASGYATPYDMIDAWMKSAGHRAHILNERLTEVGAGVAKNTNGRFYWSLMSYGGRYVWEEVKKVGEL